MAPLVAPVITRAAKDAGLAPHDLVYGAEHINQANAEQAAQIDGALVKVQFQLLELQTVCLGYVGIGIRLTNEGAASE